MTNSDVRKWYLGKVAAVPQLNAEWIKQQVPLEERARRAWKIRHVARLEARSVMKRRAEVTLLRARDRLMYGNPDGPTFNQLVQAGRNAGVSAEETFLRIIDGAQTTSGFVDWAFGPKKSPPRKRPPKNGK